MTMQPQQIVEKMMSRDTFSQWLGIEVLEVGAGNCVLRMKIREEMCNGFGIAHGGISFSFADSALAFACNSQGKHALSIETSISHTKSLNVGDVITATAVEKSKSNRIAIYEVIVTNASGDTVALFKGTVFRKDTLWEE